MYLPPKMPPVDFQSNGGDANDVDVDDDEKLFLELPRTTSGS